MQEFILKCRKLMEGPGPSEAIVEVVTKDGDTLELIVDTDLVEDDYLRIGPVVARQNGGLLIELPRETVSGQTRVWVSSDRVQAVA